MLYIYLAAYFMVCLERGVFLACCLWIMSGECMFIFSLSLQFTHSVNTYMNYIYWPIC